MGRFHIKALADPRIEIPDGRFDAIIFDCDGTLVDTMPLHYAAWSESLRIHNAPYAFTEDLFYELAGVREQDVVRQLNEEYSVAIDPDSVAEVKMGIFMETLHRVRPVEPVASLARASAASEIPVAVASGSEEPTVRSCLDTTGLLHLFEVIITPRLVARGKPAPDMFLLAAERLGVEPGRCLVLEDGHSGMIAAREAGMEAVFIPRTLR
jgi:beta-phosphoglucomutase-like phosphatase (HAD superfamily)